MGRTVALLGGLAGVVIVLLLYGIDPQQSHIYPKCPFRVLTGWSCPGCGSLRAMHDLLHGQWSEAFRHNAMLVTALPLLMGAWLHKRWSGGVKSLWNSNLVAWSSLVALVAWGVFRNIFCTHGCCH